MRIHETDQAWPRRAESSGGPRCAGLTLIEAAVYLALVGVIAAPLVSATIVSVRGISERDAVGRTEESNRVILFRLASDLRQVIASSVVVSADGKTITFQEPAGFNDTGVLPGATVSFEVRLAPGETGNGADDDGDTLIDEGLLVRREMTTGTEIVVAENLSYAASGFAAVDENAVSISVTSLGKYRRGDDIVQVQVSRELTLNPRN